MPKKSKIKPKVEDVSSDEQEKYSKKKRDEMDEEEDEQKGYLDPENDDEENLQLEEEEEEEEDENEYQKGDFVVSDDEESEDYDKIQKKKDKKKKKKKKKIMDELDDDDYDLLNNNKKELRKKLKRLDAVPNRSNLDEEMEIEDINDEFFIEDERKKPRMSRRHSIDLDEEGSRETNEAENEKYFNELQFMDLLEPEEVAEKFLSVEDYKIVNANAPERYHLRFGAREGYMMLGSDGKRKFLDESEWIKNQMNLNDTSDVDFSGAIHKILNMIHGSNHEIMYIHLYKRGTFEPFKPHDKGYYAEHLLQDPEILKADKKHTVNLLPNDCLKLNHLWKIYDLDLEWNILSKKMGYYQYLREKMKGYDVTSFYEFELRQVDLYIEHLLYEMKKIMKPEEFEKERRMESVMEDLAEQDNQPQYKPLIRESFVFEANMLGITNLAKEYFITPKILDENLQRKTHKTQIPISPNKTPEEIFKNFINPDSKITYSIENIHKALVYYVAEDLFHYPEIRKRLKTEYLNQVRISTNPTSKGKKDIDIHNFYFPVKRLVELLPDNLIEGKTSKTNRSGCLWLLMVEAEEKGYIEIIFSKPWKDFDQTPLGRSLLYDNGYLDREKNDPYFDTYIQLWNNIRKEALNTLINVFLLPNFEKDLRSSLTEASENFVIEKCKKKFKRMISLQPARVSDEEVSVFEVENICSVIAITLDPDNPGMVALVMLDEFGEYVNELILKNYVRVRDNGSSLFESYERDKNNMINFITTNKPGLIVIGANTYQACNLKTELEENTNSSSIKIRYGEMSIPIAWAKTTKAHNSFPSTHNLVLQAISLGRLSQNPTAEVLNLWAEKPSDNRLLYIYFHPLQEKVNKLKLQNALEKVAIETVNKAGVDINRCIQHPHLRSQIQFICGLGPRKATHMVDEIKKKLKGVVSSRNCLRKLKCLYPFHDNDDNVDQDIKYPVYRDAIPFIKIKYDNQDIRFTRNKRKNNDESDDVNFLDTTRINPKHYSLAEKLARFLIGEESGENRLSTNDVIKIILDKEGRKSELDNQKSDAIAKYIREAYDKTKKNSRNVVNFIISEFSKPFYDYRPKQGNETTVKLADIARESKWTFANNAVINVKIRNIVESQANNDRGRESNAFLSVVTDSGIPASIKLSDFGGNLQIDELYKRFTAGEYVTALIEKIDNKDLKIHLTANLVKLNDTKKFLNEIRRLYSLSAQQLQFDPKEDFHPYDPEATQKQQLFVPRKIAHPKFKNIGYQQALVMLDSKSYGEFIIRPSSSNSNALSVIWKIYNEIFVNLTLIEGQKGPNEAISKQLKLGENRTYTSLDNFIDEYLKKCNDHVSMLVKHPKFNTSIVIEKIDEALREEKQKKDRYTPYLFHFRKDVPQFLVLAYLVQGSEIKREYIKIRPEGLFFHNSDYPDLQKLISFFKNNFHKEEYKKYARKVAIPLLEKENNIPKTIDRGQSHPRGDRSERQPSSRIDRRRKAEDTPKGGNTPGDSNWGDSKSQNTVKSSNNNFSSNNRFSNSRDDNFNNSWGNQGRSNFNYRNHNNDNKFERKSNFRPRGGHDGNQDGPDNGNFRGGYHGRGKGGFRDNRGGGSRGNYNRFDHNNDMGSRGNKGNYDRGDRMSKPPGERRGRVDDMKRSRSRSQGKMNRNRTTKGSDWGASGGGMTPTNNWGASVHGGDSNRGDLQVQQQDEW